MVLQLTPPSGTPRSRKTGHCKSKTSRGLTSDLMPNSGLTEEDVQRGVWEELKLVKSDLKKVRKEQKLLKSHLTDLVGSCIRNILKEEVVPTICTSLEDTIWRGVEELKHASSQSAQLVRSSGKCLEKDEGRNLQLQFKTRLSLSVFTGQKVKGEQGVPIEVVLVNANTGNIVETGPESSDKLEVVVLEGGFRTEDDDNWTREEFEKYLVKEREGKRPLLTGNLEVILERGTGVLGEIEFTDNSSWTRSKKFRIGLQVSRRYRENIRVREATTESFAVKENRGELYKKHVPPASHDVVWRLKTIAKDGPFHKKLNEAGIYKVEEFLRKYYTDSDKLKNILGSGVTKKWEDLLNHAKTCTLNGKFYVYYQDNKSDHGVIFNNVGQLTGLTAHGVYCAADQISLQQKDHADRLVKKACENWNDVRQFNPEASSSSMSEKISCSFLSGVLGDQGCCHPVHDNMPLPRLASQVGLRVPSESSAFTGEGMGSDWLRGKEKVAGNSGISPARLPELSESLYSQNCMWNQASDSLIQIERSADTEVVIGQLDGSLLSFPSFNTEDDWELFFKD